MAWQQELQAQFANREELSASALVAAFDLPAEIPEDALMQGLSVFKEEYGVSVGRLRPSDSLALFTEPPRTRNPIRWLFVRAAFEDRTSELNYRLAKRLRSIGAPARVRPLSTLRDYVLAWQGRE